MRSLLPSLAGYSPLSLKWHAFAREEDADDGSSFFVVQVAPPADANVEAGRPREPMTDITRKGQRLRIDDEAQSADPELPAFIAKPESAPVYHGFPLLVNSEHDYYDSSYGREKAQHEKHMISHGRSLIATRNGEAPLLASRSQR